MMRSKTTRGLKALSGIVGKCKGRQDVRHVDCGGAIAVTGQGTLRMPIGLGFAERGGKVGFGIDCATWRTFQGFCMDCGISGLFIRADIKPKGSTVGKRSIS